jgi:hypothetical protein
VGGDSLRQEQRREQQIRRDISGQSTYHLLKEQEAPGGPEGREASTLKPLLQEQYQGAVYAVKTQLQQQYEQQLNQQIQSFLSYLQPGISYQEAMQQLSKWKEEQLAAAQPQIEKAAQQTVKGEVITAMAVAAGIGGAVLAPVAAGVGAAAGAASQTVWTGVMERRLPTVEEALTAAGFSAAASAIAGPLLSKVPLPKILTEPGLTGAAARIGTVSAVSAGLGAASAAVSGKDVVRGAVAGALAGAAAGTVFEVAGASASFIRKRASEWLTEKYLEKGPLEWKDAKEEFVMKITGAKPTKPISVVDIPDFPEPTAASLYKQAQAWELAESPGTSAFLATKYVGGTGQRVSEWVMEHWLVRATGGLSYALVQPELQTWKPAAEERQLPRFPQMEQQSPIVSPIFPIIVPSKPSRAEREERVSFPPTLPILPRTPTLPSEKLREEKVKIPAFFSRQEAEPIQKATLEISPILEVSPVQVQAAKTKTAAEILQESPPVMAPPTLQKLRFPRTFETKRENIFTSSFKRSLFGGKYVKRHQIALPSQVSKQILTVSSRGRGKRGAGLGISLGFGGSLDKLVFGGGRRKSGKASLLRGSLAEVVFG